MLKTKLCVIFQRVIMISFQTNFKVTEKKIVNATLKGCLHYGEIALS